MERFWKSVPSSVRQCPQDSSVTSVRKLAPLGSIEGNCTSNASNRISKLIPCVSRNQAEACKFLVGVVLSIAQSLIDNLSSSNCCQSSNGYEPQKQHGEGKETAREEREREKVMRRGGAYFILSFAAAMTMFGDLPPFSEEWEGGSSVKGHVP